MAVKRVALAAEINTQTPAELWIAAALFSRRFRILCVGFPVMLLCRRRCRPVVKLQSSLSKNSGEKKLSGPTILYVSDWL